MLSIERSKLNYSDLWEEFEDKKLPAIFLKACSWSSVFRFGMERDSP